MVDESFFGNCRFKYEQRVELASEARAAGANEAADALEADAAEMKRALDAYPPLAAVMHKARVARDEAEVRASEIHRKWQEGRARRSDREDAVEDWNALRVHFVDAEQAAFVVLHKGVEMRAKDLDGILKIAESSIEKIVLACLRGYGDELESADPMAGSRLTNAKGEPQYVRYVSETDDARIAVFEPIFVERALNKYDGLSGEPEFRNSAKSIDALKKAFAYREQRRKGLASAPANERFSFDGTDEKREWRSALVPRLP